MIPASAGTGLFRKPVPTFRDHALAFLAHDPKTEVEVLVILLKMAAK
jgi:hypothetical protein